MIERIDESERTRRLAPDDDERVGEAVESFLALAERGQAPDVDEFVARYPDLKDDVRAALEGLELVHGLLGLGSATGSGSGRGGIGDHRIESGRRIAGYRVVRELGRGGMGTVYEAVHVGLDRPVALKVLGTHAAPDSSARRRFLNEARTAAGLHHTHIVPVFDVGQVGGLVLLRHAAHRRERARSSRPPPAPRPVACVAMAREIPGRRKTGAGRLGELVGQFAARQALAAGIVRLAPAAGADGPSERPATMRSGFDSPRDPGAGRRVAPRAVIGLNDSTVSWAGGSRRSASHPQAVQRGEGRCPGWLDRSRGRLPAFDADPRGHDDESPPFDPPRGSAYFRWVAAVGLQAADALAHAHRLGVIHRDVKPSNLLVDARGNIWVTDFGLARRLADPGLTHHDSLLGTPRYMSPEQARTGAIDGRTDVYSLGATLYELLTLRPPFDGRSAAELVEQIGQDEPVAPGAIDRRIPRDLETIVLKALAKRPADRYATAAELAEDLERFLNREPVKARRISPPGRLWRVACRHPRVTAFTTGAAATIVAITTYAYVRVLAERDDARHARDQKQEALLYAEEANRERKATEMKQRGLAQDDRGRGASGAPNRRSQGLDLIRQIVDLAPEPELRAKLRDEAVKFLVLREVQAHEPELQTGLARGLVFGPTGHRLVVLSDDNEQLAFWDVGRRVRQNVVSLRAIAGTGPASVRTVADRTTRAPIEPRPAQAQIPAATRQPKHTGQSPRPVLVRRPAAGSKRSVRGHNLARVQRPGSHRPRPRRTGSHAQSHQTAPCAASLGDPGGKRLVTIEQIDSTMRWDRWCAESLRGVSLEPRTSRPADRQAGMEPEAVPPAGRRAADSAWSPSVPTVRPSPSPRLGEILCQAVLGAGRTAARQTRRPR